MNTHVMHLIVLGVLGFALVAASQASLLSSLSGGIGAKIGVAVRAQGDLAKAASDYAEAVADVQATVQDANALLNHPATTAAAANDPEYAALVEKLKADLIGDAELEADLPADVRTLQNDVNTLLH